MNLLFYKPSCHLSIYIISHLLHYLSSTTSPSNIYVVLQEDPSFSIQTQWIQLLERFDLTYLYKKPFANLVLIQEKDLYIKEFFLHIQSQIHSILYFHLPSVRTDLTMKEYEHLFLKDFDLLFTFQRPIYSLLSLFHLHSSYQKFIQQKWILPQKKKRKKIPHRIFYYSLYLGEDERGIRSNHPFIDSYYELLSYAVSHPLPPKVFELLHVDHLHSIFLQLLSLFKNEVQISSFESFFYNTSQPQLFPFSHSSTSSHHSCLHSERNDNGYPATDNRHPPKLNKLIEPIQEYHKTLYHLLHKKKNKIHIFSYSSPVSILPYFQRDDYHLKDSILPSKKLDIFSSIIAFITLNVISIFILLLIFSYKYIENKKYLIFLLILYVIKIPPIFNEVQKNVGKSLSSVYDYYSGNVIFDDYQKIEKEKNYIYCWNPHQIVPLGSFLSIISEKWIEAMKEHRPIMNVCHELLVYAPYSSHVLDLFQFKACTKYNIVNEIRKNNSVGIWLGGAKEMLYQEENKDILYIRNRSGIFKSALEEGISLIPTFTFGEESSYQTKIESYQFSFYKHIIPLPHPKSLLQEFTKLFNTFQQKPEYLTVIGEPIIVEKKENITEEDINELRERYIEEIQFIYHKYKKMRYTKEKELVIL